MTRHQISRAPRRILPFCAALALAACQPTAAPPEAPAPAANTARVDNAVESGSGADREDSAENAGSAAGTEASAGALFDGRITGLEHPGQARHLTSLIPIADGYLMVGAEQSRRGTMLRTWLLPNGPQARPRAPLAEQNVPHRENSPVQVVGVPGVGAYALRATDTLGVPGLNASMTMRQIGLDGSIEEVARTIEIPNWLMRSAWTATRLGDEALVCFVASTPTPSVVAVPEVVACGLLAFDGTWSVDPVRLGASVAPEVSVIAPFTGGGNGVNTLLSWVDPGNEGHVMGCVVSVVAADDGQRGLRCTEPLALTQRPLGTDPEYTHRRTPAFMATEGGLVYVLPATATLQAQAGGVALDGTRVGSVRDVIMLAGLLEAPRMVHGIRAPVMLYDSVGRAGERTAIVFLTDGVQVTDLVGMFAPDDPRGQSRLGPTSENVGSFVYTDADGHVAIMLREMARL